MRLLRGVLRLALCDWQLATVDRRFTVEACDSQLAPTSSLCRDVVFRRVFQCEVDWNFAELLFGCVGDHSMLCIVARCDGFLIRLSFLCMSGDKCISVVSRVHFASLSWVLKVSPLHFAESGISPVHQNCRCLCLSRTHPHRSKQHAQTRISVGWATGRQHFKSDYAWSTSSLHTCLLSVSTLCDFRAAIWNNSPKKKTKLKDDPLPFSSELSLPLTLQSACPSVMFSFCFTCVFRFGRPAASPCRYCFERMWFVVLVV